MWRRRCRACTPAAPGHPRDGEAGRRGHVLDVGEPFRAQQVVSDVRRHDAQGGIAREPDGLTSGGPSLRVIEPRGPRTPAAPAADMVARKSRRDCMICMRGLLFLSPASISSRVASAKRLTTGATAAELKALIRLSLRKDRTVRRPRKAPRASLGPLRLPPSRPPMASQVSGQQPANRARPSLPCLRDCPNRVTTSLSALAHGTSALRPTAAVTRPNVWSAA